MPYRRGESKTPRVFEIHCLRAYAPLESLRGVVHLCVECKRHPFAREATTRLLPGRLGTKLHIGGSTNGMAHVFASSA